MGKITNSKITELEKKIDNQEDEIKELKKRSDTKMAKIKFIGVDFDPVEYKIGEDKINKYLDGGFEVLRDFQTAGGIVMALGKWKKRKDSAEKKKWNK
jgi:predicted  nucleic acid-binding Zn-ribbon protein